MGRTVARLACASQSQPLGRPSTTPCCGLAESAGACMGFQASLPWRGKRVRAGSQRTSRTCLRSKQAFCLRPQRRCSTSRKCGGVCATKSRLGGCGQRCAAEAATSSPWSLETEARATCLRLWQALADGSKPCHPFSDCWHASQDMFLAETPPGGGKETGQTAQMERGNTTFRQWVSRYVRQR